MNLDEILNISRMVQRESGKDKIDIELIKQILSSVDLFFDQNWYFLNDFSMDLHNIEKIGIYQGHSIGSIVLDNNISELIKKLNLNGVKTRYCCGGHSVLQEKIRYLNHYVNLCVDGKIGLFEVIMRGKSNGISTIDLIRMFSKVDVYSANSFVSDIYIKFDGNIFNKKESKNFFIESFNIVRLKNPSFYPILQRDDLLKELHDFLI